MLEKKSEFQHGQDAVVGRLRETLPEIPNIGIGGRTKLVLAFSPRSLIAATSCADAACPSRSYPPRYTCRFCSVTQMWPSHFCVRRCRVTPRYFDVWRRPVTDRGPPDRGPRFGRPTRTLGGVRGGGLSPPFSPSAAVPI